EREVRDSDNRWHQLRVRPYRTMDRRVHPVKPKLLRRSRPRRRAKLHAAPASSENRAHNHLEQDQLLAELETLRQAQIEIEHSQQLYAELFDLAPVGYLNLTSTGKIQ